MTARTVVWLPNSPDKPPAKTPAHHLPNVLPAHHSRSDYDFDYSDGVWGPIRVGAPLTGGPDLVWCRRHAWEKEIIPDGDVFAVADPKLGKAWGWKCPLCHRTRMSQAWSKTQAQTSLDTHRQGKHNGHPVSVRLETTPGQTSSPRAARRNANRARHEAAAALVDDHPRDALVAGLDFLERERPGSLTLIRSLLNRKFPNNPERPPDVTTPQPPATTGDDLDEQREAVDILAFTGQQCLDSNPRSRSQLDLFMFGLFVELEGLGNMRQMSLAPKTHPAEDLVETGIHNQWPDPDPDNEHVTTFFAACHRVVEQVKTLVATGWFTHPTAVMGRLIADLCMLIEKDYILRPLFFDADDGRFVGPGPDVAPGLTAAFIVAWRNEHDTEPAAGGGSRR